MGHICVFFPCVVYSYTCRCKQKLNDNFNEQTNTLLYKNIPLTFYSQKGCERVYVGYVWEVSWRRRETATYWPQVPLTIAALLPHSAGLLNQGPEGPSPLSGAGSHSVGILSPTGSATQTPTDWLQLKLQLQLELSALNSNWLKPSVAPGYIIVWHPPTSCGRMHLHRIQPRPQVKVIFRYLRPDATVSAVSLLIYTGASLNWRLGRGSICYTCNTTCMYIVHVKL